MKPHLERLIWLDDWDICVIADATRMDQWLEVTSDIPWISDGDNSEWSVGSCSPEWYTKTFIPAAIPDGDIGVVTANPFAAKTDDKPSHLTGIPLHSNPEVDYIDYVFQDSWGCDVEGGYLDVTHPAVVTERAWQAWEDEDLDRLVVHYMQPHLPFRSRPEWFGRRANLKHFGNGDNEYHERNKEIWQELRDGEVDRDEVWESYCDNLSWVLEHIHRLWEAADAEFLLTADHGNAMGEQGVWSHPADVRIPELREVPWVFLSGRGSGGFESAEYSDYKPEGREMPIQEGVRTRLKNLGYMT